MKTNKFDWLGKRWPMFLIIKDVYLFRSTALPIRAFKRLINQFSSRAFGTWLRMVEWFQPTFANYLMVAMVLLDETYKQKWVMNCCLFSLPSHLASWPGISTGWAKYHVIYRYNFCFKLVSKYLYSIILIVIQIYKEDTQNQVNYRQAWHYNTLQLHNIYITSS